MSAMWKVATMAGKAVIPGLLLALWLVGCEGAEEEEYTDGDNNASNNGGNNGDNNGDNNTSNNGDNSGQNNGDNNDNNSDPDGETQALCEDTGGRWDEGSCGHYRCGGAPECAAIIPGCDCGPSASFVEGQGCAADRCGPALEECGDLVDNDLDGEVDEGCDTQDAQALCEDTGGRWDELSCGHYQCGEAPACEAIIPGCDCGRGSIFTEGEGCLAVPGCGTPPEEEECDGIDNDGDGEVDEDCELMPEECGDGIDNDRDGLVDEECGADNLALCVETGGRWDERSCGDYLCGAGPLCDAIIPGCDCGEVSNFVEGRGCVEDRACLGNAELCGDAVDNDRDGEVDEGCDPAEEQCGDGIDNDGDGSVDETCDRVALLCEGSGGRWHPESCGDYVCGDAPDCEAIIPGCDCGPNANFSDTRGCLEDDACGGIIVGEACDGIDNDRDGEVDEGCPPNTDAALCERTNGDWVENSCGHYSCGNAPLCNAVIPGCNCGALANFVDGQGCVEDRACR